MTVNTRGIRSPQPAGTILGRLRTRGGPGPAGPVNISDLAQAIVATGQLSGAAVGGGGGSSFITAVDSNFTVSTGTLQLHTAADDTLITNISGGSAEPGASTYTAAFDHAFGSTAATFLQRGVSAWGAVALSGDATLSNTGAITIANNAITTAKINAAAVTYAKIQNGASNGLLGVNSGGAPTEVSIGSGLTLSGGSLTASGGGGTTLNSRGAWNSSLAYNPGDVVTYLGSAYLNYVAVAAAGATAQQWTNIASMTISTTNTTNDTAVAAGANANCIGNISKASGKWYYEFQCSSLVDNGTQMDASVTGGPLVSTASAQFGGNIVCTAAGGGTSSFAGLSNTKRGAIAVDIGGQLFWVTPDVSASPIVWNTGGSANPATGVGGVAIGSMTTPWVPAFYTQSTNGQKSIIFSRPADLTIPSVPSGFSPWSTATSSNPSPDVTDGNWLSQGAIVIGTTEVGGGSGSTKLLYDNLGVVGELTALPNGTTATTQSAGDNTTSVATDAFVTTAVNNAIAGVNPAVAVQAATTAAANTSSYVYNNGVGGVGATLTGPTNNVAVTIDGFTFTALGQRLLVKNDTQSPSGAFNGVYYVTTLQGTLIKPILTRALDYDMPSDMNNTGAIPVVNGTVNALTSWLLTSQVTSVGVDPLTYAQFSSASFPSSTTPTFQVFTSGSAATYTTPAGVKWIRVRMAGGGGGGAGANSSTGAQVAGGAGGDTIFNSIHAAGGSGASAATSTVPGTGGLGGTGGTGSAIFRAAGNGGGGTVFKDSTAANAGAAPGGGSAFFGGGGAGAGAAGSGASQAGGNAVANTGGGGGGATDFSVTYFNVGASGGGGESVELVIGSPSGTYTYTVGASGSGGSSTANGGNGAAGIIVVEEHYNA